MIEQWSSLSSKAIDDESKSVEVFLHLYCSSIENHKQADWKDVENDKHSVKSTIPHTLSSVSFNSLESNNLLVQKEGQNVSNKNSIPFTTSSGSIVSLGSDIQMGWKDVENGKPSNKNALQHTTSSVSFASLESGNQLDLKDTEFEKWCLASAQAYAITSASSGRPIFINVQGGRPNIDKLFQEIFKEPYVPAPMSKLYVGLNQDVHSTAQGQIVSTLVCGVSELIDAVSEASYKYGANFQAEEFNF